MAILYIHGLDSSPNEAKMAEIEKHGNAIGLHLNYREQVDAFQILSKTIEENNITHIIGSSMGGYLGFYLAHKYQLPCLLFNPALSQRSVEVGVERLKQECPKRLIVLGMKDEVVDPKETIDFLDSSPYVALEQEVIHNQNLEHQIPLDVFSKAVQYFLG